VSRPLDAFARAADAIAYPVHRVIHATASPLHGAFATAIAAGGEQKRQAQKQEIGRFHGRRLGFSKEISSGGPDAFEEGAGQVKSTSREPSPRPKVKLKLTIDKPFGRVHLAGMSELTEIYQN
jgi:hypothetical protein